MDTLLGSMQPSAETVTSADSVTVAAVLTAGSQSRGIVNASRCDINVDAMLTAQLNVEVSLWNLSVELHSR